MAEWEDRLVEAAGQIAEIAAGMEEHAGCFGTLPARLMEIAARLRATTPLCRVPSACECFVWEPAVGWMPRWWAWTYSLGLAILIAATPRRDV